MNLVPLRYGDTHTYIRPDDVTAIIPRFIYSEPKGAGNLPIIGNYEIERRGFPSVVTDMPIADILRMLGIKEKSAHEEAPLARPTSDMLPREVAIRDMFAMGCTDFGRLSRADIYTLLFIIDQERAKQK